MADDGEPVVPLQAIPYSWDEASLPPSESIQLWNEVGNGIDKSQTGMYTCNGFFLVFVCNTMDS